MHDPSISCEGQKATVNVAVVVVSFASTGKGGALLLQMAQALSVLAIYDTRAPGGPTTYVRKGG
jgi:hypothetical protein